ncbi:hypothetical protein SARC_12203 [Sphaeroforma arctica JP610]|uniref:EF-hand domain-containing protein n=1 Tax=Sphaeroforma arctica JP610 TaxID=667725 RepID=A0A0L0FES4_9EUKA|nr:hypothetical protein SARC_12203 [Sphaeroforma arctica JP610]KNC75269.1 hypothetical protein SARC_12203 [Sphaeroforma arctica JP610]|eukprot:XP_014149171.1 hypothetical protein SARC_12203 [Sphaeroforma arctica JP610]
MKDLAETVAKDIPGEIATPSVLLKRLTSEQVKEMFEQFDLNNDGELSEEELGQACRQLGLPFSAKESEQIGHQLMQAADENDDKSLSLSGRSFYIFQWDRLYLFDVVLDENDDMSLSLSGRSIYIF